MPMEPIELRVDSSSEGGTRSSRTYDLLKREILTCQLAPSQMIYEKEICRRLDISKQIAREALKQLAQEELVLAIPSIGYRVSPLTIEDVRDFVEMRKLLERAVCERAVERVTEPQLIQLDGLVRDSYAMLDYAAADEETRVFWYESNTRFHLRIADIAGSRRLFKAMRATMEEQFRLYFLKPGPVGKKAALVTVTNHKQIVDALRQRKAQLAYALSVEDIERYLDTIEQVLLATQSGALGTA